MRRASADLLVFLVLAGCVSAPPADRSQVIREALASTVQLRAEREGGGRRSASGVVLAADARAGRSWVLTTRHFLDPLVPQRLSLVAPRPGDRVRLEIATVGVDADLALIEVQGVVLPPVALKDGVQLGDEVWVVAFPWGRRATVVSGVVSQLTSEAGEGAVAGPPRMVDASVSYGSSGGGVFDANTGALVGLVEGYRTAHMAGPSPTDRALQIPVPGETTIISVRSIRCFLGASPLASMLPMAEAAGAPGSGAPACGR